MEAYPAWMHQLVISQLRINPRLYNTFYTSLYTILPALPRSTEDSPLHTLENRHKIPRVRQNALLVLACIPTSRSHTLNKLHVRPAHSRAVGARDPVLGAPVREAEE